MQANPAEANLRGLNTKLNTGARRGWLALTLVACAIPAAGQFGAIAGGGAQSTRAAQLPLSGRTGQSGNVGTTQNTVNTGGSNSVNLLNSQVSVQGPFAGSVPTGTLTGQPVSLSLSDAISRGLQYNLGSITSDQATRQARGQRLVALSALLPNIAGDLRVAEQSTALAEVGFNFNFPGFSLPRVIGPFHYYDARASLSQNVIDLTSLRNYRAAKENVRSQEFSAKDARDLVVLAVSGVYLQILSDMGRVASAQAQVSTAQAVFTQATDRLKAGLNARIDETRSQVQFQTQQQRLTLLEADLAKQKLLLARLIGLPPGQSIAVSDTLPFTPLTSITLEHALDEAYRNRADLQAAESQVRASEHTVSAAKAEYYPSFGVNADYGLVGRNPTEGSTTFSVSGSLRVPIFTGGRIRGELEQAQAALAQRRAEVADLRGRVDYDVRNAWIDLQAAARQVDVAKSNVDLAADQLLQSRDRFTAGITDTIEVVQGEEVVATANNDYISAVYSHNLAKISLARAMGTAETRVKEFLGGK